MTTELVTKKSRRTKGKDADLASELESLEEEIGKVREKLSREQKETSKLKEILADSMALKTQAVSAKAESDAKVREQTRRIDDLEKELLKAMSVTKNAEQQSKESNKVKGDTVKETKRLLEENEQMQNEVSYFNALRLSQDDTVAHPFQQNLEQHLLKSCAAERAYCAVEVA